MGRSSKPQRRSDTVAAPRAQRRICVLCGRAFAIVVPPDELERERDKLCPEWANLPVPPNEPPVGA